MRNKKLIIPKQNGHICWTICVCQMTFLLSIVAIVYLTVAVYLPAYRAYNSGIVETPQMCTTTQAFRNKTCQWGSCGEWCLSKGTGPCLQIFVNLRRNGSSLLFTNCANSANKTCFGFDTEAAKNFTCIKDECKNLTGTFNCTKGVCHNITEAFDCKFEQKDPITKCSTRRGKVTCIYIQGVFSCSQGNCERSKKPDCERRCFDYPTYKKNVVLLSGDRVIMSKCSAARNLTTDTEVWNDSESNVLMASCFEVKKTEDGLEASDCVNGSVLNQELATFTNFTNLTNLHHTEAQLISTIAPLESNLTIWNKANLTINLEGCVNTLSDECKEFFKVYAKDGSDHNARARFPCFYSKLLPGIAVVRFDLQKVYQQFIIAFLLPTVLLVVSCLTLFLCQRLVVVGDDSIMRFKRVVAEETRLVITLRT